MSDRRQRRFAVYHVTAPEGLSQNPQRPWSLPEVVARAELFVKNVSIHDAQGYVRTFNKRQLQRGTPVGLWAVVVRIPRFRAEGGSA